MQLRLLQELDVVMVRRLPLSQHLFLPFQPFSVWLLQPVCSPVNYALCCPLFGDRTQQHVYFSYCEAFYVPQATYHTIWWLLLCLQRGKGQNVVKKLGLKLDVKKIKKNR
jgi:hypothetical protein